MRSKWKSAELILFFQLFETVLKISVFVLVWLLYYMDLYTEANITTNYVRFGMIIIYIGFYYLARKTLLLDITSINMIPNLVSTQILVCLFADILMYMFLAFTLMSFPNAMPMLVVFLTQLVLILGWTYMIPYIHSYRNSQSSKKNTLFIIGENVQWQNDILDNDVFKNEFDVTGQFVLTEWNFNYILRTISSADCVFLCEVDTAQRNKLIDYCRRKGIEVYVAPSVTDIMFFGADVKHLSYRLFYALDSHVPPVEYRIVKRCFDVVMSFLALLILSPVFLIVAIAIKAYDHGPVFYKQTRLTKHGRHFKIIKFRSMIVNAEKDGKARFSSGAKDDRVTPVGKIIRKFRIDELPQLINILKGEMSFVGPRPERPEIVAQLSKELPEFDIRLEAKAGLTGYAQVYGKYNTSLSEKLQLDLVYIEKQSLVMDFHILLETVKVIFTPESTEGVEQEGLKIK